MHHKRRRPRSTRAGCKMCKPWKKNGVNKRAKHVARASDFRRLQDDGPDLWWPGAEDGGDDGNRNGHV